MTARPSCGSPTEEIVSAQGLSMFVREQGDGYPLLMINGIGVASDGWGAVERTLAVSSRTIVFDAPGTGRSEAPLLPRSLPALARIVGALLDELGHQRVDVLGFSFGGTLAQQLARDAADRLRRLALVSTFCGWGATSCTSVALGRSIASSALSSNPLGATYQLVALAGWSSLPWLSKIEAPTLVLAGGADELVPAQNSAQLARLLPHSRLQLLPDAGHLSVLDPHFTGMSLLAEFFSSASHEDSTAWTTGS